MPLPKKKKKKPWSYVCFEFYDLIFSLCLVAEKMLGLEGFKLWELEIFLETQYKKNKRKKEISSLLLLNKFA